MMLSLIKKSIQAITNFIDPTKENNNTKKTKDAAAETVVEVSKYFSKSINDTIDIAQNTEKFLKNAEHITKRQSTKKDTQSKTIPLQEYANLYQDTKNTAEKLSTQATDTLQTIFDNTKLSTKLDKTISLADNSLSELYKSSIKLSQTLNGTHQFIESIADEGLKDKTEKANKIITDGTVKTLKKINPLHLPTTSVAKIVKSAIKTGEEGSEIDLEKTKFSYDINEKAKKLSEDMQEIYREGGENINDMLKRTDNIFKSLFTTEVRDSHSIKSPNTPNVRNDKEESIKL